MQLQPPKLKNHLCMGVIVGAHGIKGEVKFKPFTENPKKLKGLSPLCTENKTPMPISAVKQVGKGYFALTLEGTHTCEEASALKGTHLYAPREVLGDELLIHDFIGLIAVYNSGKTLGDIQNVFDNGAHLVLEIQDKTGKLILIPYVEQYVAEVGSDSVILTDDASVFEDI